MARSVVLVLLGALLGVAGLLAGLELGGGGGARRAAALLDDGEASDERAVLEARVNALLDEVQRLRAAPPGLVGASRTGPRPPAGPPTPEGGEADDAVGVQQAASDAVEVLMDGALLESVADVRRLSTSLDRLEGLGPVAIEALRAGVVDDGLPAAVRARHLDLLRQLDAPRAAVLAAGLLDPRPQDPALLASVLAALGAAEVRAHAELLRELGQDPALDPDLRLVALRLWVGDGSDDALAFVRNLLDGGPADRALAARLLDVLPATSAAAADLLRRALFTPDLLEGPSQERVMTRLAAAKGPDWAAVQLLGPPDTALGGDHRSAWASRGADMGEVTIEVGFARGVRPETVRVHETFNPGAVAAIEVPDGRGGWRALWSGPADRGRAPRWFAPPLAPLSSAVDRVRLVLDTNRVPGWNEIDAVELVGDGLRQWAHDVSASSSYAGP